MQVAENFSQSSTVRSSSIDRSRTPILELHQNEDKAAARYGKLDSTKQSNLSLDQTLVGEEWRRDFPQLKMISVCDSVGESIKLESEVSNIPFSTYIHLTTF